MHFIQLKTELNFIDTNLQTCKKKERALRSDIKVLTQIMKTKPEDKYYRLKTYMNDRYFLNKEMMESLNYAKAYLTSAQKKDFVYDSYIGRYNQLMRQFDGKSNDPDFINLYSELQSAYPVLFNPDSYIETI